MVTRVIVVLGLCAWLAGCTQNCSDVGCLGQKVSLELVDEDGNRVPARGKLSYASHSTEFFDCTRAPDPYHNDYPCEDGVITLEPIYNRDDTIKIRFELEDGTSTDWQSVELTIEKRVLPDFNGPD